MRRIAAGAGRRARQPGCRTGRAALDTRLTWDANAAHAHHRAGNAKPTRPFRARLEYLPSIPARVAPRRRATHVNGPGAGDNAGLPSRIGVSAPPDASRSPTPSCSPPSAWCRLRTTRRGPRSWLTHGRRCCSSPGVDVPATRLLPSAVRVEENALRARLAQTFEFPANAHIAPLLARALDRVGECRRALGITRRWRVLRAQDDDGGSRYELGLGVDVEAVPAAELDALVANHVAGRIAADTPAAIRALLGADAAPGSQRGSTRALAACPVRARHRAPARRHQDRTSHTWPCTVWSSART